MQRPVEREGGWGEGEEAKATTRGRTGGKNEGGKHGVAHERVYVGREEMSREWQVLAREERRGKKRKNEYLFTIGFRLEEAAERSLPTMASMARG